MVLIGVFISVPLTHSNFFNQPFVIYMKTMKIATAQFENKSGDKAYNLSVIEKLAEKAAMEQVEIIAFHECSVSGYTFAKDLSRDQMLGIAEVIPEGDSLQELIRIAKKHDIIIMAGLFEKDASQLLYNTYVCVDKDCLIARFRKLHPFINPHLAAGDTYCVFDIRGWKCGILICYDNNVMENVRATRLLGAEIVIMPHVTMCTPSSRPGAGFVDPELWENRLADPTSLREEFDSLKGRKWLMKWLPARAYDNGIYAIFSNPIGMDGDQVKNGCSMIVDPFGDILAECRSFEDSYVTATLFREKLSQAGGSRYIQARRPDLYRDILGQHHESEQKVAWLKSE